MIYLERNVVVLVNYEYKCVDRYKFASQYLKFKNKFYIEVKILGSISRIDMKES